MRPMIPRCSPTQLSRLARSSLRQASTIPKPSPTPITPTTFSAKAAPRASTHDIPEAKRGFPPSPPRPVASSSNATTGQTGLGMAGSARARAFEGPSRPRMIYERVGRRDLPKLKNKWPIYIAAATAGLSVWAVIILYATNAERLASSVLRSITFQLRHSPDVIAVLGDHIRLEDPWWAVGDPWISGSVNMMQGRVDLSFRVKGIKDAGTVYFTSIRPNAGDPWRIVRYKLIADSGCALRLEDSVEKPL